MDTQSALYLIEILHQTTTRYSVYTLRVGLYLIEILHQTTTQSTVDRNAAALYLIEILHQTTTWRKNTKIFVCCILSKFYIKPQLCAIHEVSLPSCILSKFYIKPQHSWCHGYQFNVVSYRNSTSNHNKRSNRVTIARVVSYRNSTSNHNTSLSLGVVFALYLIEILHQTTTLVPLALFPPGCILSKFYIKPQRVPARSS